MTTAGTVYVLQQDPLIRAASKNEVFRRFVGGIEVLRVRRATSFEIELRSTPMLFVSDRESCVDLDRCCRMHITKHAPHNNRTEAATTMKAFAVARSSFQRLLATPSPHRTIIQQCLLSSSSSCEEIHDVIPDYFDTLGMEVRRIYDGEFQQHGT